MLYEAGRKKHKKKEQQRVIGFNNTKYDGNGLFERSDDFPGFAFRVDEAKKAEFQYTGKVIMPLKLYQKMFLYAINCTKEVSGLGMVEREGNELRITDLFIVKQEVTAGNTTLDNKDLAKKTIDLIAAGGDPSKMKLWWHCHLGGGTYWSATDERCCEAYNNDQWLLSMVVNYKKELRCRLDIYNPIRITLDYIPVVIEEPISYLSELEEECKEDMKDKVREPATSFQYGANAPSAYQRKSWKCSICEYVDEDCKTVANHMMKMHNFDSTAAWNAVHWVKEVEEVKEEEVPDELDVNRDTPPDILTGSFEDLYNESRDMEFHTLSFYDTFNIFWNWDTVDQKYYPLWGKKTLSSKEYVFLAESLSAGVKVDKELNVV